MFLCCNVVRLTETPSPPPQPIKKEKQKGREWRICTDRWIFKFQYSNKLRLWVWEEKRRTFQPVSSLMCKKKPKTKREPLVDEPLSHRAVPYMWPTMHTGGAQTAFSNEGARGGTSPGGRISHLKERKTFRLQEALCDKRTKSKCTVGLSTRSLQSTTVNLIVKNEVLKKKKDKTKTVAYIVCGKAAVKVAKLHLMLTLSLTCRHQRS